jgi:hypothetical protein
MGLVAALVAASAVGWLAYVAWAFTRSFKETLGDRYFKLPLAERRALKERIAARARLVLPLIEAVVRVRPPRTLPSCVYRGVHGPSAVCSARTFEQTFRMRPDARDVFVATQMKCGTTWMQQIVYEVLSRGRGDLGDTGHRHLYALSPWVESRQSVALDDAPRIGPRQQRLLKTHMPADLVPWSPAARYIYVARHPVACFASTVDFLRLLTGPLAPPAPELLDWFLSDRMYWRPWPDHVAGWWDQATERPNVLFVHYEEMLADLPRAVARVAAFLDVPLAPAELEAVVGKSSFAYMKAHEERFEMAPPSLLTGAGSYLPSGSRARERELDEVSRQRILAYCRERLAARAYPAARFYPELRPAADGA